MLTDENVKDVAMTLDVEAEYVTVPEAARILGVSASTIWRWIDRGDLPASRFGRRRVRVARTDLPRVIRPARSLDVRALVPGGPTLTPEERERALRALERARELGARLAAKYGPFSDSTEIIREMREERSRHLAEL
jgi:excisionase family DNA binding protein